MIGPERLVADFRAMGFNVDGPIESGGQRWAIVHGYRVPAGRFGGQVIDVAIPAPIDYPAIPPGGLYVSPFLVPESEMGGLSVHDRPGETAALPGRWQYWSRPIPPGTWRSLAGAKRLITHWNAVMANVN